MDEKKNRGYYKSPIPLPEESPSIYDLVDKKTAISFLTKKMLEYESDKTATRDRISHLVKHDVKTEKLEFDGGKIVFGRLIAWARGKKTLAPALKGVPQILDLGVHEEMTATDGERTDLFPGSQERSHEQLAMLYDRIETLEKKLRECLAENAQLRPKAERYENICAKNKENPKKHK